MIRNGFQSYAIPLPAGGGGVSACSNSLLHTHHAGYNTLATIKTVCLNLRKVFCFLRRNSCIRAFTMTFKITFAAAALCVAFAAPVSAASLTSAELRALAPGNYAVSIYGLVKMTISMQSGGSISGITSKKKRDSGFWSVSGDKLCIRWNRWLKKKTRCTSLSGKNGTYSGGGLYIRKI
jgi:hypothetical protein